MSCDKIIQELRAKADELIEQLIRAEDLPATAKESIERVVKPQLDALWSALDHVTRLPEN